MMDGKLPTPQEPTPMQELSDALRPAVEQVRAAVPPPAAVERSVDRAVRLGPPPRRRSRRWMAWSAAAAAGIAAAFLVSYELQTGEIQKLPEQVAWNKNGDESAPDKKTVSESEQVDLSREVEPGKENQPGKSPGEKRDEDEEKLRLDDSNSPKDRKSPATEPPVEFPPSGRPTPPGMADDAGKNKGDKGRPAGDFGLPSSSQSSGDNFRFDPSSRGERDKFDGRSGSGEGKDGKPGEGKDGKGGGRGKDKLTLETEARKKQKEIAETWGRLPERAREQKMEELKKAITTRDLEATRLRLMAEEGVINVNLVKLTEGKLKDAEKRLKSLQQQIPESVLKEKTPQVWHRDRSRPTFARVYVGNGNSLEMVSLNVSVTIEGPRARTVVDHVFRNPHNQQLEGTFEYPLPTGASPSYFAMFLGQTRDTVPARFARRGNDRPLPATALASLTPAELVKQVDTTDWGRLQEARIVSKEKALETYEEVVRGRIDPALLEYAGGNTFSGRVFPIPAKGYNRVILAYEELLPVAQDKMLYRFPLPACKLNELQFTLQAKSADCLQPSFLPKDAKKDQSSGQTTFTRTWKDTKPQGEVVFACTPADPLVQTISGRQGDNGPRYLYARLRPQLKTVAKDNAFASHAVFLLDTSLSEHPDRFAVNVKLLRKILESDKSIQHFNILTFNVGAAWLDAKNFFDNTAAGREKALKKLDGLVLEGATDISCALDKLANPGFELAAGTNLNVFLLSDGHITWGEPDVAALVARFEQRSTMPTRFHCYRTGLGEENSELFEALTRKGGGVFQCFGEADLNAAALAHRNQCMRVDRVRFVGGPAASDVLVSGRRAAVYPGGELVVAARFNGTGRTTVILEGEFAGKKMVQEFPLEVRSGSELAPRAWGEVAVASLLALHDSNLDPLVTAYCQQFGLVSRVASFLVLENDNDYKRFNLEEERDKTLAGDLGTFVADAWKQLSQATPANKAFARFLSQIDKRVNLLNGANGAHVKQMLALLKEGDFELPVSPLRGGLVYAKDVADYLNERNRDRRNVGAYLKEAQRRAESGDVNGAVRVLSSIIEEYPARGDALRLVGYRLVDLKQPAQAARLFSQVQKQRPFEPHSYRDLAHALEESGKYGLAAINYEIVLTGTWHNRFRQELKVVAQEEYAHMMQEAIRSKSLSKSLANHFGERLEQMSRPQPKSDLRVTISWNTDATDIDLWVIEPDGTKCFYSHNRTKNGGELSQDQTQGYGPERYQVAKAQPGVYTIIVHYYRPNPNLLGGETHVNVRVSRQAGSPQETVERHTVILKQHNQQVEVCKIKF
jgi:tetratricopeptide (TPR) repeat protein